MKGPRGLTVSVSCELQVIELKVDADPGRYVQVAGETEAEEGGDVDWGEPVDTDEEYLPPADTCSTTLPTSLAQKRKAQSKTTSKNDDGVEEDSNKDSGQCPICLKSFKSKYYLKVHNRYQVHIYLISKDSCSIERI